jgi:hypothetical protein
VITSSKEKDKSKDNKSSDEPKEDPVSTKENPEKDSDSPKKKPVKYCTCNERSGKEDDTPGDDDKKEDPKSDEQEPVMSGGLGGSWTAEQDQKIKEMKSENKSWKEIATVVGASKKALQNRFKELQKEQQEGEKTDSGGNSATAGAEGQGGSDVDAGGLDFSALFLDADFGVNIGESNHKASVSGDTEQGKKKKHDAGGKSKENQQNNNNDQSNYIYEGYQDQQYPGRLKVNKIWSRDDCEILEYLEARYREHKWLHMQANFFNLTGRMVAAEIIQQKFKDDEYPCTDY